MVTGFSDLLKSREKGKFNEKNFAFTKEAKEAFEELKRFFTTVPILIYYDLAWRIMVESDASSFAILAVILELLEAKRQWHPVAFWLQKMQSAERNYRVSKSEMLAIVEACKHWQHYLEGTTDKVRMITDYCNLRTFFTTKSHTLQSKVVGATLWIKYKDWVLSQEEEPSRWTFSTFWLYGRSQQ